MKELAKTSALMGGSEFILILMAVIRTKYLAVTIGPEGYGGYGFLVSFFSFFMVFTTGWLGKGYIKYVAEYNSIKDKNKIQEIHNFCFSIAIFVTSFIVLLLFIFSKPIMVNIFKSKILVSYYYLYCAQFFFSSLSPFFGFLFSGLIETKTIIYIRLLNTFFQLLLFILLVYFFSLLGFYITNLVSSIFALFLFRHYSKRFVSTKIIIPNFKRDLSKKILKFGYMSLYLQIITKLTDFIQNLLVASFGGLQALGIIESGKKIVNYMSIFDKGANFYGQAKLAERLNFARQNKIFNDYLRFSIYLGLPISLISILFIKFGITLLLSNKFIELEKIFYLFAIYSLTKSINSGFHHLILGKAFIKFHTIFTSIEQVIFILLPILFLKKIGLSIVIESMILGNIFYSFFAYFHLRKKVDLNITQKNYLLLIMSGILIFFSVKLATVPVSFRILFLLTVLLSLIILLEKGERKILLNQISKKFVK